MSLAPCAGTARSADAVWNAFAARDQGMPDWSTEEKVIEYAVDLNDELTGNALWVSYAMDNNVVIIEDCNIGSNAEADHIPCSLATTDVVISISSLLLYGDITVRSFNFDGSAIERAPVNYSPLLRPWYKENGWIEYEFINGNIGHSFAISVDGGAVLGDYWPVAGECDMSIENAPCDEAALDSVVVLNAMAISDLDEVSEGIFNLEDALALGNAIMGETSVSWAAVAYNDEIVAVINCEHLEVVSAVCGTADEAGSTIVISVVSFEIFGNNNWHSYIPDGTELERDAVEYLPSARPWFLANGWTAYDFVNQDGDVTGRGYTYVIPIESSKAIVAIDYHESEGICPAETTAGSFALAFSLVFAALALL